MESAQLLKFFLFSGMSEDQFDNIIPFMAEEEYSADDIIIKEGKINDKIFFIIRGQVSVIKKDTFLYNYSEGEHFGEMEVLDVIPADATIKAVTPVTAATISNKALRAMYNTDAKTFSHITMNLTRDLSRRLRKLGKLYTISKQQE
ncbi:MAG: cyclic nucleotide-binding domain-containing protein [Treponema sp.]|nr:cyclic nucleotide-binding domain-containing protein [Treponema sp.]